MAKPSRKKIIEAIEAFLNARTGEEQWRLVRSQSNILLTDAADRVLLALLAEYKDDEMTVRELQMCRTLFARCRHEGIDNAFADFLASKTLGRGLIPRNPPGLVIKYANDPIPSWKSIIEAVVAFVNTGQTWAEKKRIVEAQQAVLLTDAADHILADLLLQYQDDQEVAEALYLYRMLLTRCRDDIVDAFLPLLLPYVSREFVGVVEEFAFADVKRAKQLIEEWQEHLLSDEALQVMLLLQQKNEHNPEALNRLKDRYKMLERCRREGIAAVFPDHLANISENMFETLASFLNAETIEEQKRIIEDRQEEMFSIAFDLLLAQVIEVYKKKNDLGTVHKLRACRVMIERCRRMGIAAGIAELMTSEYYPPAELVLSFINAPTSDAQKRIVEEHHDVLFTESVSNFILDLLVHNKDDEIMASVIKYRLQLLERCRRRGIEAAFAEDQRFLLLLGEFTKADKGPHLVEIGLELVELVDRNIMPLLWGDIHLMIGEILARNPSGDLANNLEEAIKHYHLALEVLTQEKSPELWAKVQSNMGIAYVERIKGTRTSNLVLTTVYTRAGGELTDPQEGCKLKDIKITSSGEQPCLGVKP